MKKIILSLTALMMAAYASAQSYPKQPDRTVVNYIEYKKEVKAEAETDTEVQAEEQGSVETARAKEQTNDEAAVVQPATSVNSNTVTENRRNNDRMKKE